VKAGGAKLWV